MEQYGKKGPFNNAMKENYILEKFYEENFQKKDAEVLENYKASKVNLARNEVVENLDIASVDDYVRNANKDLRIVSSETITLSKQEQCLNLVFYCSTNYFDIENPQKGICSGKNEEILANLADLNPNGKTAVIFGGNLLGEEWQIKYLKNARIENNKAIYFGINKRKYRLNKDIRKFFKMGEKLGLDLDVYLMRGNQEKAILKELNRDVMGEVYEELKDKYVNGKNSRLHYLNGESLTLNITKQNKNKSVFNATIGLQTNMTNKSLTASGDVRANFKTNGVLPSDVCFVCNGNYAGKLGDNIYHVSGQSKYARTTRSTTTNTQIAPKNYNVFTLYVEGNKELTVQEGGANIFPEGLEIQNELYKESKKRKYLLEACSDFIENQLKKIKLSSEDVTK